MPNLEERIYDWLLKKSRNSASGKIRSSALMSSLCQAIINDPVEVRKALENLRRDGKVEYTAAPNGTPVSAFVTVIKPETNVPEHRLRWESALASSGLGESDAYALEPLADVMHGLSDQQMVAIIMGLGKLRQEQDRLFGQPLFNISATYLLGSSKLLSVFNNRALKAFGIDIDRFPDRPPYVVVGGNGQDPEAVILVENPISFETAVQSRAGIRCAFICTFGFGLSHQGNDYGNQLAGAIESGTSMLLRRSDGHWGDLTSLLAHQNLHFWGDLDCAGMQIYERLASKLPHIQLSALYEPMLSAADNPDTRHPYVTAVGKEGQKGFTASRSDARKMLAHCREWAVDQEIVSIPEMERLAGWVLN